MRALASVFEERPSSREACRCPPPGPAHASLREQRANVARGDAPRPRRLRKGRATQTNQCPANPGRFRPRHSRGLQTMGLRLSGPVHSNVSPRLGRCGEPSMSPRPAQCLERAMPRCRRHAPYPRTSSGIQAAPRRLRCHRTWQAAGTHSHPALRLGYSPGVSH
jgi:hypothetical protein